MNKFGDKLPNGATVIECYNGFVLAHYTGPDPFVTWRINSDGECESGHYYLHVVNAAEDFKQRTFYGKV